MNRFLKSFLIVSLAWAIPGNAYFNLGQIWKKNVGGKEKILVLLGDRHDEHAQNENQFCELMRCVPGDATIIYEGMRPFIISKQSKNSRFLNAWYKLMGACALPRSPLSYIGLEAPKYGINIINVEFRDYARSFREWFNANKNQLTYEHVNAEIQKIIKENNQFLAETHAYEGRDEAYKANRALEEFIHKHGAQNPAAQIADNHEYCQLLPQRVIESSRLIIDMRILQAIFERHNTSATSVLFVCAGSAHIKRIEQAIRNSLGYRWIKTAEKNDAPIDIAQLLDGRFTQKRDVAAPAIFKNKYFSKPKNVIAVGATLLTGMCLGGYYLYKYMRGLVVAAK